VVAQVDDFTSVVKHPAPEGLAGNWQTVGRKAVWSVLRPFLIITPEGDTLDCRQWQRVIAVPGKLMPRGDDWYNVTQQRDIYRLERDGNQLEYDGMTLRRVDKPTVECRRRWRKRLLALNPERRR
jgi:hypothetical protein